MEEQPQALPSLSEVARKMQFLLDLSENDITDALKRAGENPHNEAERERFRLLFEDTRRQREYDRLGELGVSTDKAVAELGEDAPVEDLVKRAEKIAQEGWEREQEEEDGEKESSD